MAVCIFFCNKKYSTLSIYSVLLSVFKSRNQFYPVKLFSTDDLFLTFQTFIPSLSPCYISSSISLCQKLNNALQGSKKLNVPTGINPITNFYNISKTLVYNITCRNFKCNVNERLPGHVII